MPTSPRNLTGRTGRYKRAAQLSNPRDDEGIVPYAKGKNVPCNQVRPNISGVPYTPAGGRLPPGEGKEAPPPEVAFPYGEGGRAKP